MIDVRQLSFTYPGAKEAILKNLNFSIQEGEIFGFLGPSGAGKSTTQKILYKILRNYQGEIHIKGKALDEWGNDYLSRVGVGFELPNHYLKLTARENLQLFSEFYAKAQIQDFPTLFELVGMADSMDKRVEAYSKGMKMRLNFIRAIMHNPDILFFDEPTAGLDPVNAHRVKEHILALRRQGKTIFITTHNMTTADEICDRVSFIVDGEIRLTEAPASLKLQHGKKTVKVELTNGQEAEFEPQALGDNPTFIQFLQKGELHRIHTQEASLEEVFIKVTGKSLVA
ncbi:MAG: ABC transporter ATP-binding protein [Bacteroidota bacterium]